MPEIAIASRSSTKHYRESKDVISLSENILPGRRPSTRSFIGEL